MRIWSSATVRRGRRRMSTVRCPVRCSASVRAGRCCVSGTGARPLIAVSGSSAAFSAVACTETAIKEEDHQVGDDPPATNHSPVTPVHDHQRSEGPGSPGALLHRGPSGCTVHARSRAHGPGKPRGRFRSCCAALQSCIASAVPASTGGGSWGPFTEVSNLSPWCWHLPLLRFNGSPAHVSTPFRGRAPGPVSGRFFAGHPGGVPDAAVCGFLLRSAAGVRFLGHPVPPEAIPPPVLSAYPTSSADAPLTPTLAGFPRSPRVRPGPGRALSLPPGRRCSQAIELSVAAACHRTTAGP